MKNKYDYFEEIPKLKRLNKIEKAVWRAFSMSSMVGQVMTKGRFNPHNDKRIFTPDWNYIRILRKKKKKGVYERAVLRIPKTHY